MDNAATEKMVAKSKMRNIFPVFSTADTIVLIYKNSKYSAKIC